VDKFVRVGEAGRETGKGGRAKKPVLAAEDPQRHSVGVSGNVSRNTLPSYPRGVGT
jgi:hypothetical protein